MKRLRQLANVAILSPLLVPVALVIGFGWLFHIPQPTEEQKWAGSFGLAIVVGFLGIATGILFLAGVALHGFVAARTQKSCRWAWWFILLVSGVSALVVRPTGTVVGVLLIVLLLAARPFRIMKNGVEQDKD